MPPVSWVPGRIVFLDDGSEATSLEHAAATDTPMGTYGVEWRLTDIRRGALWVTEPAGVAKGIVLVVPGGGYEFVSLRHEGMATAAYLNALGYAAAVLIYRLPAHIKHHATIIDAERALEWIDFGSWPTVGVLGFSAGAHLALMTVWATCQMTTQRIDWLALIYPVFRLRGPHAHEGTAEQIAHRSSVVRDLFDGPQCIDATLPPIFARHHRDDPVVPAMNTVELAAALSDRNVVHDVAVVPGQGHGFGFDAAISDAFVGFLDDRRVDLEASVAKPGA